MRAQAAQVVQAARALQCNTRGHGNVTKHGNKHGNKHSNEHGNEHGNEYSNEYGNEHVAEHVAEYGWAPQAAQYT